MFSRVQQPCGLETAHDLARGEEGWRSQSLHTTAEVAEAVCRVTEAMAGLGYPERDVFGMRLALEEALVNALKHGNRGDPRKEARLRYRVDAGRVLAEVEDEGPGFDPNEVPDPLDPENLDRPSGRGLLLMRSYTTWLRFNRRGNRLTLCKERTPAR